MTHPAYNQDGPDHGTEEFLAKHRTIHVPTEDAGIMAAQVIEECLLDALRIGGLLGSGDDAQRRYDAGLWLRRLFDRAGFRRRLGMAFEEDSGGHPEGCACRPCEAQGWNHRCWLETMRDAGRYAYVLRSVCVFDELPNRYTLRDVASGLDILADLRGL